MSTLRRYTLFIYMLLMATVAGAQERRVENRPYTDLRPFHLGIVVGTHLQDTKFENVGQQTLTLSDGTQMQSLVTTDQDSWEAGFNVGVLGELRLSEHFAFRIAPQLYFGTRNITFHNYNESATTPRVETQSTKTVYVGGDLDLIYAAKRFNNHRPYLMVGLAPMINLTGKSSDYIQLKGQEVFFEVGMGCDFYLPFFKLRPELKFMFGLTNALKKVQREGDESDLMMPYSESVSSAKSNMVTLSFYFE